MHRIRFIVASIVLLAGLMPQGNAANLDPDSNLLTAREAVWRSWFANDTKALEQLVPPETIVISAGEKEWKHQAEVLATAADFRAQGGKLLRLAFPRTEVQHFGDVAIVWSQYVLETELHGKKSTSSGRATEIFVLRDGHWTNPGWHTDAEK